MLVRAILIFIIIIGMVPGHYMIEEGAEHPDFDKLWIEYEASDTTADQLVPEPVMKGLMYGVAKIATLGVELSKMVYPHGLELAVVLGILTLINFQWLLYPILIVYVLIDEKKRDKKIDTKI